MDDLTEETGLAAQSDAPDSPRAPQPDEAERRLAARIRNRIRRDKKHWEPRFKEMLRDMAIARLGASETWVEADNYTANITGRHIKQMVSTLYAKNPKAIARRRDRLDFLVWDESEQSLIMAQQTLMMWQQQAMTGMGDPVDPTTGMPMVPPEVQQAQMLLQDFQEGMQERRITERVGKTLEVLFSYYMQEQKPVNFKTAMKQLVRRTSTCGVGYIELGFQRELESDPQIEQSIRDVREQIEHIRVLQEKIADPDERGTKEADERELQLSLNSLMEQQYVLIREGLVFDFPQSNRVIPHDRCSAITGFVGCDWLTLEYLYTPEEVQRLFKIDLGRGYTPYTQDGKSLGEDGQMDLDLEDIGEGAARDGLVCVWKHYDRVAGLVYYVADGYKGFLRPPGSPDVYVEGFWPVHALTFNECEDPKNPIPPSDVKLMRSMQDEWNRSRQGKREHRIAARPRGLSRSGALSDEDKVNLGTAPPFFITEVNPVDGTALDDIVRWMEVPGVDPNLYDVNEVAADMQMTVGRSPAQLGASNRSTATGEAIAEEAGAEASGSNVDDLDEFLSAVSRDAGQIMLRELSPETVQKIAGRGSVWPQLTLEELAGEVYLEIEAGSSGKPNAAQEIRNWREMLPFLIQMGSINPTWLARESLRRLDDRMDLTDAIADGLPAITAMNRNAGGGGVMGDDPGNAPDAQGPEGAGNAAPAPSIPAGGERGMGNNQL